MPILVRVRMAVACWRFVVLVVRMRHRAVRVGVHVPDRRGGIILVVRVRVRVRVPAPLRQRAALEPAHHPDDHQRRPHDALPPLRDDLHVERQLVPEQHEDEAEEDLARVVAQAPQRAHHRVLHPRRPDGEGSERREVVRARQRVKTSRQEPRVAALDRHGRSHERRGGHRARRPRRHTRSHRGIQPRAPGATREKHRETRRRRRPPKRLPAKGAEQSHAVDGDEKRRALVQQHGEPQGKRPDQRRKGRAHDGRARERDVLAKHRLGPRRQVEKLGELRDAVRVGVKQEDVRGGGGGFGGRGRHRHADVRGGQRGRIVDPVADHDDPLVFLRRVRRVGPSFLLDDAELIVRGEPGADRGTRQTHGIGDGVGARRVIPREHQHVHALAAAPRAGAKVRDRLGRLWVERVGEPEDAREVLRLPRGVHVDVARRVHVHVHVLCLRVDHRPGRLPNRQSRDGVGRVAPRRRRASHLPSLALVAENLARPVGVPEPRQPRGAARVAILRRHPRRRRRAHQALHPASRDDAEIAHRDRGERPRRLVRRGVEDGASDGVRRAPLQRRRDGQRGGGLERERKLSIGGGHGRWGRGAESVGRVSLRRVRVSLRHRHVTVLGVHHAHVRGNAAPATAAPAAAVCRRLAALRVGAEPGRGGTRGDGLVVRAGGETHPVEEGIQPLLAGVRGARPANNLTGEAGGHPHDPGGCGCGKDEQSGGAEVPPRHQHHHREGTRRVVVQEPGERRHVHPQVRVRPPHLRHRVRPAARARHDRHPHPRERPREPLAHPLEHGQRHRPHLLDQTQGVQRPRHEQPQRPHLRARVHQHRRPRRVRDHLPPRGEQLGSHLEHAGVDVVPSLRERQRHGHVEPLPGGEHPGRCQRGVGDELGVVVQRQRLGLLGAQEGAHGGGRCGDVIKHQLLPRGRRGRGHDQDPEHHDEREGKEEEQDGHGDGHRGHDRRRCRQREQLLADDLPLALHHRGE
mmetsp:Transcript_6834/g.27860  ORF Transcript_6834/g.27860 Transcript_6834/m.27860 type:complete len:973 (+) Transcript_6834:2039-4957(+)